MTATATAAATTTSAADPARARAASRLPALDWMRGLVMVLMAIDHSSDAYNGGRLFSDAVWLWHAGSPLPAAQFVTRWITHICAPTFLFLAGTSLAFTVSRQVAAGDRASGIASTESGSARRSRSRGGAGTLPGSPWEIDRYIVVRGLVIAAFELWISLTVISNGKLIFQVLWGIGSAYVLMAPLRRLSDGATLALGLFLIGAGELLVSLAGPVPGLPLKLLVTGGSYGRLLIAYPTIHWLAILLLGWWWGRRLVKSPEARITAGRDLARAGVAALALFILLRAIDGYGNMRLYRDSWAPLQWLHVSKYPPSITYDALELGLMALIMAFMFRLAAHRSARPNSLLMVLGQVPMFFYLLHFPILVGSARLFGLEKKCGVGASYLGAAAVVALLYPLCRWYRGYKARHRTGWVRFV